VSWKTVALGDVCEMYQPKTITLKELVIDGEYFVYGANGIIGKYSSFNHEKSQLVIGCRGSVGSVHITKPKSWITGNAMVVYPKFDDIDLRFLEYFFRGAVDLSKAITGAAQPQITRTSLSPINFSYPSILTQHKIVAKLDSIFAEIDKATAAAEANAKNAEVLFLQILNNIENEFSGNSKELGDCVKLLSGFAFKSNDYTDTLNDIPLLRGDNLSPKIIDFSEAKRFDRNRYEEYEKFSLSTNDIVLGMDRPIISTGLRIAKVESKDVPSLLVQRVMRLRCNKDVDADFLFYLLNSTKFIKHLIGEQTGLGVPHISGKTISCYPIKVPSIETQRKVVSKLDAIVEKLDSYKKANYNISKNWTCYRQSILKKAFAGELVKE
jgi:type I restriction enzyme S subunit